VTHTVNVYTDTAANVKGNAYAQFTNEAGKLEKWWNGSHQVPDGFAVFFLAEANVGYEFDYWIDNVGAKVTTPSFDRAITGYYAVTAFFKVEGSHEPPELIETYLGWELYRRAATAVPRFFGIKGAVQTPDYGSLVELKSYISNLEPPVLIETYKGWALYSAPEVYSDGTVATKYWGEMAGGRTGFFVSLAELKVYIDGLTPPVECSVDADCPAGQVCVNGVCVTPPPPPPPVTCSVDADCPAGQVCVGGVCVPAPTPPPVIPALDYGALGFGAVYAFLLALSMWASY
jgi:Cys-rich repeat protein